MNSQHVESTEFLIVPFKILLLMLWAAVTCLLTPAYARTEMDADVGIEEASDLDGRKLVLNGTSDFRIGGLKAGIVALYLSTKDSSVESISRLEKPMRIRLYVQRDFSGETVSRMYLADFKQNASEDEFKKIVTAVGQIGAAYAGIKGVSKGDVVNMDWMPGKGFSASISGRPVCAEPNTQLIIKDALAYQIQLRRYIGPKAPEKLKQGLLGM